MSEIAALEQSTEEGTAKNIRIFGCTEASQEDRALSVQAWRKTTHLRSSGCFMPGCFFPKLVGFVPNLQSPAP